MKNYHNRKGVRKIVVATLLGRQRRNTRQVYPRGGMPRLMNSWNNLPLRKRVSFRNETSFARAPVIRFVRIRNEIQFLSLPLLLLLSRNRTTGVEKRAAVVQFRAPRAPRNWEHARWARCREFSFRFAVGVRRVYVSPDVGVLISCAAR